MDSLHQTVQQLRSELGRYKHRVHKAEQQVVKVGMCRESYGGEKEGEGTKIMLHVYLSLL